MKLNIKDNCNTLLVVIYFANAVIEVVAEYFSFKPILYITKPLIPFLLMVLYFYNSPKKDWFFFLIMTFSLMTNIFFIPSDDKLLFYGVICFTIHRMLLLILVFKIVKIKDYIPFTLATLPLGFIFFYLLTATEVPENSFYLLIFTNFLASILGGIAISGYIMNDTKQNSLLLISVLLFLGLQLVVFIEKYYFADSHSDLLRPLAMSLNALAFFAFYSFVIYSEKLNYNRGSFAG